MGRILMLGLLGITSSILALATVKYVKNEDTSKYFVVENVTSEGVSEIVLYYSPIDIEYLRSKEFTGSDIRIEEEIAPGVNYKQYIASYKSERNRIYGLLTVPNGEVPEGGHPAIVFNHGYIPPKQYVTTEKYIAYVDNLAKNGFIVFKIDFRGHGKSEGQPQGTYFSPGYTIDALNAVASLKRYEKVNPGKIGMWGHSMAGNLTLRAMLVSDDIKAGVIWAGAVYSYEDFAKYRINDTSYVPRERTNEEQEVEEESMSEQEQQLATIASEQIQKLRSDPDDIDFSEDFWTSISLTKNLNYLNFPVQIHHAKNDAVVNVGYSVDLAASLEESNKTYEFYEYEGGGHNINSPYFETAISRTVDFFKENL